MVAAKSGVDFLKVIHFQMNFRRRILKTFIRIIVILMLLVTLFTKMMSGVK